MDAPRVLIVDDEPAMLENVERILVSEGYACEGLAESRRFREVAASFDPDVILTDLRMSGADGMTILAAAVADDPTRPVIMMTAYASVTTAVAAVREGAFDFVTKPFTGDQLLVAVDRAARYRGLTKENRSLRTQVVRSVEGAEILGSSPLMTHLLDQAARVAPTDANVLLTGESGTGKELVARYLHAHSLRRDRPFVPVDCVAMPEGLLEAELFGHTKGAFTGAVKQRQGLLAQAEGGTVFLDEIGEMPLTLQVKLLRVLEQRQMRQLGDSRLLDLDVRVVAATNRELEAAVAEGQFREDLYYRLNVVGFRLPPLRERSGDLAVMLNAFLTEFATLARRRIPRIAPEAWALLERYPWPGNVRELRNVAQRLVALDTGDVIGTAELPPSLRLAPAPSEAPADPWPIRYEDAREAAQKAFRSRYASRMLETHHGNVSQAAIAAGVSRRTFHRWLAESQGAAANDEEGA
ncbi:MAG: sigma-54 dependent transcriptional regulator [Gemmatimonadota bacterium]|nr:sigma-54 dependent transcriptional regulator [Gemmatimonadota bacterium]